MPPRTWLNLTPGAISRRLSAAGFTRHAPGVAGYEVSSDRHGAVEILHRGVYNQILDPGPEMQAWGRYLAAAGFTVHVAEDTMLLVTLPDPAATGAPHAVERAA